MPQIYDEAFSFDSFHSLFLGVACPREFLSSFLEYFQGDF
jgi:hypothetical protein